MLGALLAAILATGSILATYDRLSHTVDEPTHIASGLEWLRRGTQALHPENPPLSRVGAGLAAHLAGADLPARGTAPQRGVEILYASGDYPRTLSAARAGTLPFFWTILALAWAAAFRMGSVHAALVSVLMLATLPPLLGHAGLATTDVAFVAAFLGLLWGLFAWLERPSAGRALLFGALLGAALMTKFSTLLFFPAALVAILLVERARRFDDREGRPAWGRRLAGLLLVLPVALVVCWALYGFSIGRPADLEGADRLMALAFPDATGPGRALAESLWRRVLPAPEALHGLLFLLAHAEMGHPAYLLGEVSQRGFWGFYPVALAVKTPLTFVLLALGGVAGLARRSGGDWRAWGLVAAAAAILLVSLPSSINLGLRHILVVYPLLAVAAGVGLERLVALAGSRTPRRVLTVAVGLALASQAWLAWREHPDHLAYFNLLAGPEPAEILLDSDLDWGQDAWQLERLVAEHEIDELSIAYFGSVRLCELELPPLEWLPPGEPVRGWIAISEMYLRDHWRLVYDDPCDRLRARPAREGLSYSWLLEETPLARAGRSIRVYHLEDD